MVGAKCAAALILAVTLAASVAAAQYGPFNLTVIVGPLHQTPPQTAESPGPSATLFATPYYTCTRNFYVSTTGSDSNNGSIGSPWKTIQHADATSIVAGDCINVNPGTYSAGLAATKGGNLAVFTGYIAYRCATLLGCVINSTPCFCLGPSCQTTTGPNYIFWEGFDCRSAGGAFAQGVQVWDGQASGSALSAHHIWMVNNSFSNYGQSGVQMNDGEYFYVIHNITKLNAQVECGARGSGVTMVNLKAVAGYTPTAHDQVNPVFGSFQKGDGTFFHNNINWNATFNNTTGSCGVSDGNGIIYDSLRNQDVSGGVDYPNPSLAAFNVIYNNGGSGIQAFISSHVTAANNSTFNNYINTAINGTERNELDSQMGMDNHFLNNITYSITGAGILANNAAFNVGWSNSGLTPGSCSGTNCATTDHNLFFCSGKSGAGPFLCAQNFNGAAVVSTASNKVGSDPTYVNVGNSSNGTQTTPPVGANFALQTGSPAIGYGLSQPYLRNGKTPLDAGACDHTLTTCP